VAAVDWASFSAWVTVIALLAAAGIVVGRLVRSTWQIAARTVAHMTADRIACPGLGEFRSTSGSDWSIRIDGVTVTLVTDGARPADDLFRRARRAWDERTSLARAAGAYLVEAGEADEAADCATAAGPLAAIVLYAPPQPDGIDLLMGFSKPGDLAAWQVGFLNGAPLPAGIYHWP
jgi:hypothetical protein